MKTRRYGFKLKLWESGRYTLIHRDRSTVEGGGNGYKGHKLSDRHR
jgi:hypothetical protein